MIGAELATLVSGEVGNQIAAGYFAKSYWNFGWIGLPLLMFPVGVFFNVATHFAARVIEREDWLYLPVLFLSLKVGMQIEIMVQWFCGFGGARFGSLPHFEVWRPIPAKPGPDAAIARRRLTM